MLDGAGAYLYSQRSGDRGQTGLQSRFQGYTEKPGEKKKNRKGKKPDPDDSQNQLPFFNNCFEIELFLIAKDLTDKYFILLIYEHLKIPTVIKYTRVFKVKMRRGKGFLNYH